MTLYLNELIFESIGRNCLLGVRDLANTQKKMNMQHDGIGLLFYLLLLLSGG
jgi:hypothetical protein